MSSLYSTPHSSFGNLADREYFKILTLQSLLARSWGWWGSGHLCVWYLELTIQPPPPLSVGTMKRQAAELLARTSQHPLGFPGIPGTTHRPSPQSGEVSTNGDAGLGGKGRGRA